MISLYEFCFGKRTRTLVDQKRISSFGKPFILKRYAFFHQLFIKQAGADQMQICLAMRSALSNAQAMRFKRGWQKCAATMERESNAKRREFLQQIEGEARRLSK